MNIGGLEIKADPTKTANALAKSLTTSLNKQKTSRVLLNKFIQNIA